MELSQYLDLFISEAEDHLQEMNQALLSLESDPNNLGYLDAFFRSAHTLKGMSATMEFGRMATLSHDMEDILDVLRKREFHLTPELADLLFRCLDTLTALLQGIAAGEGENVDVAPLQESLRSVHKAPEEGPSAPVRAAPEQGWEVRVSVAPDCALRGPRAYLVLKHLSEVASVLSSDPPEAALRAGDYEGSFRVFVSLDADPRILQERAAAVAEVSSVAVGPIGEEVSPGVPPAPGEGATTVPARGGAVAVSAAPIVRIKVALLDHLLEAVAELVINRSHLAQVARRHGLPDLEEVLETHANALGLLQEAVLAMRMTPVAQVFNRFPRMVRDLAHEQGKQVRFEMEGLEIDLDRTILEKIADPLVHILRNAVDHGVETPETRQRVGKPPAASILLRARRERDQAVIEVRDDGRGLSREGIARVAVERGLISEQQALDMEDGAVFELVCQPGFSTRAEVTGVSGRGVGMGVVKEVMDEIGGDLEIESYPGEGSCFRLILPLTMAIVPALLVHVRGETYAMPVTHVVRTLEPMRSEVQLLHDQPVFWWGEQVLPLVSLSGMLGPTNGDLGQGDEEATISVVVVGRGRQQFGLVVDEILGKEEIVLKPLEGILQQIEGLAGATVRGEGEVVLVLDIPGLVRLLARGESVSQTERA